jgi:DNA-binding XRE family transcriptional regulator
MPYLYKMINKETNEFYIGCRYTEGCDPNESFEIYASSSKLVKKMIRDNPEQWEKIILLEGTEELVLLEEGYMIKQNIDNPLCLNGLNGGSIRPKTGRKPKLGMPITELNIHEYNNQLKVLSEKIKTVRNSKNISQQNLADKLGISRSTLLRLETNPDKVEMGTIIKALLLLEIPLL